MHQLTAKVKKIIILRVSSQGKLSLIQVYMSKKAASLMSLEAFAGLLPGFIYMGGEASHF